MQHLMDYLLNKAVHEDFLGKIYIDEKGYFLCSQFGEKNYLREGYKVKIKDENFKVGKRNFLVPID